MLSSLSSELVTAAKVHLPSDRTLSNCEEAARHALIETRARQISTAGTKRIGADEIDARDAANGLLHAAHDNVASHDIQDSFHNIRHELQTKLNELEQCKEGVVTAESALASNTDEKAKAKLETGVTEAKRALENKKTEALAAKKKHDVFSADIAQAHWNQNGGRFSNADEANPELAIKKHKEAAASAQSSKKWAIAGGAIATGSVAGVGGLAYVNKKKSDAKNLEKTNRVARQQVQAASRQVSELKKNVAEYQSAFQQMAAEQPSAQRSGAAAA